MYVICVQVIYSMVEKSKLLGGANPLFFRKFNIPYNEGLTTKLKGDVLYDNSQWANN